MCPWKSVASHEKIHASDEEVKERGASYWIRLSSSNFKLEIKDCIVAAASRVADDRPPS